MEIGTNGFVEHLMYVVTNCSQVAGLDWGWFEKYGTQGMKLLQIHNRSLSVSASPLHFVTKQRIFLIAFIATGVDVAPHLNVHHLDR